MSDSKCQQVVIAAWPRGEPKPSDFRLEERPLRALEEGEVLMRTTYLSLDPYMRGTMAPVEQYEGMGVPKLGDVMVGESVGVVEASRSAEFSDGDHVVGYTGWRSHTIFTTGPALAKIDPTRVPEQCYLGAAGMTGRTAYFGLMRVGRLQSGETLVVSAASGAVGSVVGQIAKIEGCRAIGIAGSPEKCRYVVEELGFDACLDYKWDGFEKGLAEACADGVDVYFENVGGPVLEAVVPLLNDGARVPICGYISNYNDLEDAPAPTPFDILDALEKPPEHAFFLVSDWPDEQWTVTDQLIEWIQAGKIKYRESIVDGLAAAPEAFIGLLRGENFGKQLVKLA